jgi:3-oxoacyl-[acyl-carrier protein] reductase
MAFDFTNKRVIVTGGSRGIGRSIALAFAGSGADVSICARSADALARTKGEIAATGRRAHAATCNVADGAAVRAYVADAAAELGGLDVLVNNTSGFGMGDDEAAWAAGLAVDIMATVRATQAALPMMERAVGSSVINIASISGFRPSLRAPGYAAVKAALLNLTTSQAMALARKGIRVNCIAPGSIEFPGGYWEERRLAKDPLYTQVLGRIPFGRLGTPEEIAEVALFLASPHARWITGQTIAVDGGQILG